VAAYLALIRIDLLLALRAKSVIFFNYLFPLIFFFVFAQSFHAGQGAVITQVVTMVAVIGTLGNGLFGAGIRAVQERESNILRRYKVTPIGPAPLLVASMVTGLLTYLPYVLLMLTLAHFVYHMVFPPNLLSILAFMSLGIVAFRAIGLIVAAVVNSMQESAILTQVLYISMLFLSGATLPTSMFPAWLLKLTQFIPATYLVNGLQSLFLRQESLLHNGPAVGALAATVVLGSFIATKLFRWEKEEKLRPAAKLWVLAVLLPFFVLGAYQIHTGGNIVKARILDRELRRSRNTLIRNARIFIGDGTVIESGSVLVKNGKIDAIYGDSAPDAVNVNADIIEAAGKTLLPGLADVHVRLAAPGGVYAKAPSGAPSAGMERALQAYLFSGVTAVRSDGDPTDNTAALRTEFNDGEQLGAEVFVSSPLFTAAHGYGLSLPASVPPQYRKMMEAQLARVPRSGPEARRMVDELAPLHVDTVRAALDSGVAGALFERMDPLILRAIGEAARSHQLPLSVHVGDQRDLEAALDAGAAAVEMESFRDHVPGAMLARMAAERVAYQPALSTVAGAVAFQSGGDGALNSSLLQQAAPPGMIAQTRRLLSVRLGAADPPGASTSADLELAKANLQAAWKAGVRLVLGSGAGNPLVIHGPTAQREMELWVEAGIPPAVALQAATANAARLLHAADRVGYIRKGMQATFVIVAGNPLQDIQTIEQVSVVILKGERVNRSELFTKD